MRATLGTFKRVQTESLRAGPGAAPPVAAGLPLVGSLPRLLLDPFAFFARARERYGDLYTLDLGLARVVVLNHPRHAQHVFVDHAHNYRKGGAFWDVLRLLLGNGLPVSEAISGGDSDG